MDLDLTLPTATALGYVAAIARVGAFVVATPILSSRVPATGRLVFTLALALALTRPLPPPDFGELVVLVVTNIAIGVVLGFVTGLMFHMFQAAGAMTDVMSGLSIGATFDPITGATASVFDRMYSLTAVTLFFILGGPDLLVRGLDASIDVIPLGGEVRFSGQLEPVIVDAIGNIVLGGLQIAAPVLAALFLTELVLGVASRLLPQANIFVIGLPAKLLVALAVGGVVVVTLPTMTQWFIDELESSFSFVLRAMRVAE